MTLGVSKTKKETNPVSECIWNESRVLFPVRASGGECGSRRFWIQGLGPDLPSGQWQGGAKCPDQNAGEARGACASPSPVTGSNTAATWSQKVFWSGIVSSGLKHPYLSVPAPFLAPPFQIIQLINTKFQEVKKPTQTQRWLLPGSKDGATAAISW